MSSRSDADEASLARHFQSLPQGSLRYASLTNLAASLTPWEARHLRLQLQRCKGLASLEDLPSELLIMLIPLLSLDDVNSCLAVSTAWRRVWAQPLIAGELCRRFFPTLPKPHTFSSFQRESHRVSLRKLGRFKYKLEKELEFETETYFQLDPDFHPISRYPRLMRPGSDGVYVSYGSGKLVWRIGTSCLVVDDFYTRKRRVLELNRDKQLLDIEGRAAFCPSSPTLASRSLLAFIQRDRCRIFAFHWKTKNWARYTFSSHVNSFHVVGEKILISLRGPKVCVLKYDGFLIEPLVETPHQLGLASIGSPVFESSFCLDDLLPNTLSETTVFIMDPGLVSRRVSKDVQTLELLSTLDVSEDEGDIVESREAILLREVCDSGHIATYDFDITSVRLAGLEREYGPSYASLYYNRLCQGDRDARIQPTFHRKGPIDGHGTYLVCLVPVRAWWAWMAGLPGPVDVHSGYVIAVTFDTVSRQFGTRTYPYTFRTRTFCDEPLGFWGEQMFVLDGEWGGLKLDVQAVDPIGSPSAGSAATPYRAEFPMSEESFKIMQPWASDEFSMRQDEDFILVATNNRYALWSFELENGADEAKCGGLPEGNQ